MEVDILSAREIKNSGKFPILIPLSALLEPDYDNVINTLVGRSITSRCMATCKSKEIHILVSFKSFKVTVPGVNLTLLRMDGSTTNADDEASKMECAQHRETIAESKLDCEDMADAARSIVDTEYFPSYMGLAEDSSGKKSRAKYKTLKTRVEEDNGSLQ